VTQETLFQQVLNYANRANPYPFYTRLRERSIWQEEDGTYLISRYDDVVSLLHDPRLSADERRLASEQTRRGPGGGEDYPAAPREDQGHPPFLFLDPPEHDRLRGLAMRHFGPPQTPGRVESLRPRVRQIVDALLDAQKGQTRFDVVDGLAYPLPVTVICELLGVPRQDESRFHAWSEILAGTLDPDPRTNTLERQRQAAEAGNQLGQYMVQLVSAHMAEPGDDLLSALATDPDPQGRMDFPNLVTTAVLLLIAGHETTVNLIANGMLTLLRHPDVLERLRREPDFVVPVVEELLRFEPPVQFRTRVTVSDVEVNGTVIPQSAKVLLLLASANRDSARFADADRFDPERPDNEHLGFGSGIHYCLGAPLARLEGQVALTELVRRLESPRLVVDPPPYRENPTLRGPRHLLVDCNAIRG
jgi:cytochrome P450